MSVLVSLVTETFSSLVLSADVDMNNLGDCVSVQVFRDESGVRISSCVSCGEMLICCVDVWIIVLLCVSGVA